MERVALAAASGVEVGELRRAGDVLSARSNEFGLTRGLPSGAVQGGSALRSESESQWRLVTCHLSLVTCHLSFVICHLSFATWNLEPGTWNLEPGTWNLEPGTCNLEPGTRGFLPFPRVPIALASNQKIFFFAASRLSVTT